MQIDAIRTVTWGLVIPYVNCPKRGSLENMVNHARNLIFFTRQNLAR